MNKGFCNTCGALVPCRPEPRDGKVYLVKECPAGHRTETLISGDAERYQIKRSLDKGAPEKGCSLQCLECRHKNLPTFVFVDITNRCNLNCPICINNTPTMGFTFDPPMEYFEKIFEHFGRQNPPPSVQLFGGEPTVRSDLLDIIALARSKNIKSVRVVTNGIRLADPEYCRKLLETRATILIAYDGANPLTYKVLRDNEKSLEQKVKALDNIRQFGKPGKTKVALMTCVARGFNDHEMGDLLKFCHDRKDIVRGVNFMPLTHSWTHDRLNLETTERMTTEDIEKMLQAAMPGDRIDFLSAGIFGQFPGLVKYLRAKPPPFVGAHPNCESFYLLISNGEEFVSVSRYLKRSLPDAVRDIIATEERFAQVVQAAGRETKGEFPDEPDAVDRRLARKAFWMAVGIARRNLRISSLIKGRGLGKAWNLLVAGAKFLTGRSRRAILARHANVQGSLMIIVLPFEDKSVLETDRLERCPNAFAFWDPRDGLVHSVPVCAWDIHKTKVMRMLTDHYAAAKKAAASAPSPSPSA